MSSPEFEYKEARCPYCKRLLFEYLCDSRGKIAIKCKYCKIVVDVELNKRVESED